MNRLLRAPSTFLVFAVLDGARIYAHMAPTPLKAQIDKHRPLLIFAPNPEDARAVKQGQLLSEADPLRERDIVVYKLPFEMPEDGSLSRKDATASRIRFHVAPKDFTVILLGKDGEEKLRSATPVTMAQLSQLIDSMPMRKQEIKAAARK